jgi:hypothetical protein
MTIWKYLKNMYLIEIRFEQFWLLYNRLQLTTFSMPKDVLSFESKLGYERRKSDLKLDGVVSFVIGL